MKTTFYVAVAVAVAAAQAVPVWLAVASSVASSIQAADCRAKLRPKCRPTRLVKRRVVPANGHRQITERVGMLAPLLEWRRETER